MSELFTIFKNNHNLLSGLGAVIQDLLSFVRYLVVSVFASLMIN